MTLNDLKSILNHIDKPRGVLWITLVTGEKIEGHLLPVGQGQIETVALYPVQRERSTIYTLAAHIVAISPVEED